MVSDELYKLAAEFWKLKLWNFLTEYQIFGVQLEDGKIAYCSVCNRNIGGENFTFTVYEGAEKFESYRNSVCRYEEFSENEDFLLNVSQNCLRLVFDSRENLLSEEIESEKNFSKRKKIYFRGKNSHPRFLKYLPLQMSFPIQNSDEEKILSLTLKAVLEVGKKFPNNLPRGIKFEDSPPLRRKFPLLTFDGENFKWSMKYFPPFRRQEYPEAKLSPRLLKKLSDAKKTESYLCEIFILPIAKEVEKNIFKFPVILMTLKESDSIFVEIEPTFDYATSTEELTSNIAKTFLKKGVPKKISVRNERTYQFLENFCEETGIELCEPAEIPTLDEEEEKLLQVLENDNFEKDDESKNLIEILLKDIIHLPVEVLKENFSEDLKIFLKNMLAKDALDPSLKEKVEKVLKD